MVPLSVTLIDLRPGFQGRDFSTLTISETTRD